MASREGINPLRPYYIPQSGLTPTTNTTPEVTSPSSTQVFGSSARDFMPDLDYADYLDSSPSVSDWVRDALNRALVRYSKVLTAQPFDVAKTILQVYVVSDNGEEQLDRKSTPRAESDPYDTVWTSFCYEILKAKLTYHRRRKNQTMKALISLRPPPRRRLQRHHDHGEAGNISQIAVATFVQTMPLPHQRMC